MSTTEESCTVHDTKKAAIIRGWVESLDGKERVAVLLGIDVSTIYRYGAAKQAVPKWLFAYMKMSEECSDLRQEKAQLKRDLIKERNKK